MSTNPKNVGNTQGSSPPRNVQSVQNLRTTSQVAAASSAAPKATEVELTAGDKLMGSSVFSIATAMSMLGLSNNLRNIIVSNRTMWRNFGKKNSHMYRAELFTSMSTSNLNTESMFVILFLFSVIKSQPRVLKELDNMTDQFKSMTWYGPVREFVASKITQYVTASNINKKFPAVNIPSCMPGFDLLVYCLITPKADRTILEFSRRTTFSQLNLNVEMQATAKAGYAYYWDEVVVGTKNEANTEAPMMREGYYKNSAADKYDLMVFGNDGALSTWEPDNTDMGYTKDEIEEYLTIMD